MAAVTDYTALLTGSYWNGIEVTGKPVFVTYSFDATAPASDQGNLSSSAYSTFTPFTAAQQTETQQALQEWSSNSGIVFLQVAPGQGDINFAAYDFSSDPNAQYAGGMGFYPWGNWNYWTYPYFSTDLPGSGNVLMNTAFETDGQFAYVTLLHEIGHALGLKHPYEAWTDYATPTPTEHNVWDSNAPPPSTVMNEGATSLTHLTGLDIQAIQSIYGTAAQQGTQDKSWSWDDTTDTLTQRITNAASIEVRGISTNNVIYAGSGNDIINAIGAGTNKVYAGKGNDTLVGGLGTNYLYAGTGADTFIGTFGPTFVEYTRATAGVSVDLTGGTANAGAAADDTFIDIHNLYGSKYGDTLIGDNVGDALYGMQGNDSVVGGSGDDTLNGGTGIDTMSGGAGNDKYYVDNKQDVVNEAVGGGDDTVFTAISYVLAAGSEIESLRALGGSAALSLTGNEFNNTINGSSGNDTLTGGLGADRLAGGAGADIFRYSSLGDSTVATSGRDTIFDFSSADGDKIDLHLLDADTTHNGNQAFNFIGSNPFSNLAGQLHYAPSGANTLVSGDVNGDGTSDFSILLKGAIALSSTDFVL